MIIIVKFLYSLVSFANVQTGKEPFSFEKETNLY